MDLCGCSRQPVITKKTFGAEDARPNSWGWVVSLSDSNGHFCMGSILSEWYIITAAQCFETRMHMLSSITFCAGTNHILSCPQRRSIQQVITNFAHSNGTLKNDIAIILVDIPFKFTNTSIARICLPNTTHENEYPQAGTNVISIGWGKNKTNSKLGRLQQITLQVMNKSADKCRSSLTNNHLQLCAAASREDISRNDSGEPLMVFTASKRWELIGITNNDYHYVGTGAVGVYIRIAAFRTFIETVINDTSSRLLTMTCTCQCPRGIAHGVAYTTGNSAEACIDACKTAQTNPCFSSNTYACLGSNCIYSTSYNYQAKTKIPYYTCSCECPRGFSQGLAYITQNSSKACVDACKDIPSYSCTRRNTYACLGANCGYSNSYKHRATTIVPLYECSCECPRGLKQGFAYTTENSVQACINTCTTIPSNRCIRRNTYACLGLSCGFSASYSLSSNPINHDVYTWVNSSTYKGYYKNGKKHGTGTYYFSSGNNYTGDWVDGNMTGYGIYTFPSGARYEGQFKDGKGHGTATYYYPNGEKYIGDWVDDKKTGYGIYTYTNGARYEGQFKDGKGHGTGTYYYPNGDKYIGDWVDDKKTGYGNYTFASGTRYEGQFKDGKGHGTGTYYYTNGDKYTGDWVEDKKMGYGIFTSPTGERYEGYYKDGNRHGTGKYRFSNGNYYTGDWIDDEMTGHGVYTWINGDQYMGQYKDNKKHGKGRMIYSSGKVKDGMWWNDTFVS